MEPSGSFSALLETVGTTYSPWLAPGAIVVSATVAIVIAIVTIWTNRVIARKRATLDLIVKSEAEKHFQDIYTKYVIVRDEFPEGIMSVSTVLEKLFLIHESDDGITLKSIASEKEIENFKAVQYYLNYHELIAVGIKNKILDERFYRDWMQRSFIGSWFDCKEFVLLWRKLGNNKKYFVNLEFFAEKWQNGWLSWKLVRMRYRVRWVSVHCTEALSPSRPMLPPTFVPRQSPSGSFKETLSPSDN